MAKVYEAMVLAQGNIPEASKKFLNDYNFTEVVAEPGSVLEDDNPLDFQAFALDEPGFHGQPDGAINTHVAVAEAITESVDSLTSSFNYPEAQPPQEVMGEVAEADEAITADFSTNQYAMPEREPESAVLAHSELNSLVPLRYREEFAQLSEIVVEASARQPLQVIVVCGVEPNDNADFVVENLSLALAEKQSLRVARFDLTSPSSAAIQALQSDAFRIRLRQTEVPNLSEISSVNGPLPLPRLINECDMDQMIEMLKGRFDYVLVKTDAVNSFAEVADLAAKADGVILVAQKENMYGQSMNTARERLQAADAKILGAVLNRHREAESLQRVA